ncbi:MAG: sensor histidine kinase [Acidimicrobiia bacterium]|nr:sensor histidine kinase [Acidimicrobiia bacterium]
MRGFGVPFQDLQIRSIRPTSVDREGIRDRLRLTVVAAGNALLGVPALLLLVLTIVGLSLVPIGVGIGFLGLVAPAMAVLTGVHRSVSGALLGVDIREGYADTSGRNILGRAYVWLRDSARWRDFAFCAFSTTGGFALSLLVPAFLVSPAVYFLGLVIDGGWTWFWLLALVSGPQLVLWWLLTPALVQARARADQGILDVTRTQQLERRVEKITALRAETVDHSAAEIRRIERDLHDGPQARIVSLGINLSRAEQLIARDPAAAEALLREARESTAGTLEELRSLVRDIHPPVLAERGLSGAIEALTLVLDIPVTLTDTLTGRPPPPVETAVYFAVAECLANIVKHAAAGCGWISLSHADGVLRTVVGDDGEGRADPSGSGLSGVRKRLDTFDGNMVLESPTGGPTTVTMEVSCVLLSPRTMPSSARD